MADIIIALGGLAIIGAGLYKFLKKSPTSIELADNILKDQQAGLGKRIKEIQEKLSNPDKTTKTPEEVEKYYEKN